MYLLGFPLLLIPFALYNIVVFIFRLPPDFWTTQAATLPMRSGQVWIATWEDAFLAGSLLLLWVEVIKSRIGGRTIVDHVLALLVFVAMLAEFVLLKSAATSTFFLLLAVGLVDVLAGVVAGPRGARQQIVGDEPVKTDEPATPPVRDVRLPFPSS
jgi:hypothetical protein